MEDSSSVLLGLEQPWYGISLEVMQGVCFSLQLNVPTEPVRIALRRSRANPHERAMCIEFFVGPLHEVLARHTFSALDGAQHLSVFSGRPTPHARSEVWMQRPHQCGDPGSLRSQYSLC